MASSRYLITSTTLGSSAASVTFSSIPSTYTDLVLRISARTTNADTKDQLSIVINSDSSTNYSDTDLYGFGTTAGSLRNSSNTFSAINSTDGNNATSNTFGSLEIYIPSYTVSQNKPFSSFAVSEDNSASGNRIFSSAQLWRNTASISSLVISSANAANFVSGSSFYLYGLKNS